MKQVKPICLNLGECNGLGDLICATPTIKKISEAYDQKIMVLSKMPELFKNNPYVSKSYKFASVDFGYIKSTHIVHNSFYNVGKKNEKGIEYKHNMMDIRQYHAVNLGFSLFKDEMQCFYYPIEDDDSLYLKHHSKSSSGIRPYVVIHPVNSWPNRTWSQDNWLKLAEALVLEGYNVVAVGKDSSETGFFNVKKPVHEMDDNVINLMNKTSISQTWYLIKNAAAVITMDSGILHLAGTTDTYIIELGSPIKPELRTPYRQGIQGYKHTYVRGECGLHCSSNMKYAMEYWPTIDSVQPLIGCLEKKKEFECHPSVEQVIKTFNKTREVYNI
jgi:ADP-heptose:LPS heptosyltransferase